MDRTRMAMVGELALPPELVTAQAASLRALARSLAGDEHAADDVVQETWLRALTSPPHERERIVGWLRRVVAGFASKRRRAEARRTDRERVYALERPEATSDARTRAETLRAVVDAVLSLEEPYRETVLLRWFEGLPPRDIAVRQGTTVATVNSRLQRAHTRLREQLSRRLHIDDRKLRGLLLACFGAGGASTVTAATSLSLLGIAVTTMKLVTGAGLAAALLCALLYFDHGTKEHENVQLATPDARAPELAAADIDAVEGNSPKRVEAATPAVTNSAAASTSATPDKYAFDVTFVVVDDAGRPEPRVAVWIGPDMERTARLGVTGWDGELHSTWRGAQPTLDLVLELRGSALHEGALRRIRLDAGAPERIVLAADRREKVPATLDLEFGRVSARVLTLTEAQPERFGFGLTVGEPEFGVDAAGNAVITDPWLLNRRYTADAVDFSYGGFAATRFADSIALSTRLELMRPLQVPEPAKASIHGVVVDENAQPLAGTWVSVYAETDAWNGNVQTDAEGRFQITNVPPGRALIFADGETHLMRREMLEGLAPDESRELRIVSPAVVRTPIRLVGEDGKPLAGWRIEARRADRNETFLDRTRLDDDGRGALELPLSEVVRLYAEPREQDQTPPMLLERGFLAEGRDTTLVVHADVRTSSYAIEVQNLSANDHGSIVMRLWRVDSGLGRPGSLVNVEAIQSGDVNKSTFKGSGLLPGDYFVELGSRGTPWTRMGPFHFAPNEEFRMGPIALEEPAQVEVRAEKPDRDTLFQATTRRQGLRVQSPPITASIPTTLLFTAGEYELSIRPNSKSSETVTTTHAIRAQSDQRTSIDLSTPR